MADRTIRDLERRIAANKGDIEAKEALFAWQKEKELVWYIGELELLPDQYEAFKTFPWKCERIPQGISLDRVQARYGKINALDLRYANLISLAIPETLTELSYLDCSRNQIAELNLPPTLAKLRHLHVGFNLLGEIHVPCMHPHGTVLRSLGQRVYAPPGVTVIEDDE